MAATNAYFKTHQTDRKVTTKAETRARLCMEDSTHAEIQDSWIQWKPLRKHQDMIVVEMKVDRKEGIRFIEEPTEILVKKDKTEAVFWNEKIRNLPLRIVIHHG